LNFVSTKSDKRFYDEERRAEDEEEGKKNSKSC
jgi:hypothetical protein